MNTHLLDRITEDTKAYSQYVLPEEDIEVKVSAFFTKIKEPALTNLKLTFPDGARVTKLYPSPLPDLFKGEQLVIAGRYTGKADGAIQIEGLVNGETRKFSYDAKFADTANDHDFIPRLWATRRVGYLLDEIRLRGESRELKDEVTELARKYSIVTPYTAYLILEDERQRGVPVASRSLPQLEQDVQVRREAKQVYDFFRDDKDGARAVAGARSFQRLKMAEASSDAIVLGNAETLRVAPAAAAPATSGLAGGSFGGGRLSSAKPVSQAAIVANEPARLVAARQYADQSQFVSGRTFFLNGSQWIDAGVQKAANARRVRVQFDSPEYFELLKQHPTATRWFSMGRNLQLLLGDAVYEIYE